MDTPACRFCGSADGDIVLDIGRQPACDNFPLVDDPGPDATYPLQMWLCADCGLAGLVDDPTDPEEPRGVEPAAVEAQAADAVRRVAEAGWLRPGLTVAEYGSPHGGSWLQLVTDRDLTVAAPSATADVVLDSFGLMHFRDQNSALRERAQRVAEGGVLLVQYHELRAIVDRGEWNMLRLGHYAYYSLSALTEMLRRVGFYPRSVWSFDLYGGTVLLAATRDDRPDESVTRLLTAEAALGIRGPRYVGGLQTSAAATATRLGNWLSDRKDKGQRVFGYCAAGRAVGMLAMAGVDTAELSGIADASEAKWGRRMPGTDIPIIRPDQLVEAKPDCVLLMLSDLLTEVRAKLPEIESGGGRWVTIDEVVGSDR
jgi:hypothetical protein